MNAKRVLTASLFNSVYNSFAFNPLCVCFKYKSARVSVDAIHSHKV